MSSGSGGIDELDVDDGERIFKKTSPSSNRRKTKVQNTLYQSSRMTPSIITTINNTDPNNPPANLPSIVNNNNIPSRNRRTNEQYESYIEDSFVGHWEHEDDDADEYQEDIDTDSTVRCGDDNSNLQHPSTIEFDFDSFGPESFIYTPTPIQNQATENKTIPTVCTDDQQTASTALISPDSMLSSVNSRPPTLVEVSSESEKQAEEDHLRAANSNDTQSVSTNSIDDDQAHNDLVKRGDLADSQTKQLHFKNLKPQYDLIDPAQIDLKVIEPYKKVISHAGYCHNFEPNAPAPSSNEPAPAVIVFSACYLPDRSRRDYNYVMDHLFLYVLTSLHELIADDYILIYLHNTQPSKQSAARGSVTSSLSNSFNISSASTSTSSTSGISNVKDDAQHQNNLPTFSWMKRCYQMIDRRLRKNLRILYLVKPTFWLKTLVIMCKPFISAKFSKKLIFIEDMDGLRKCLPVDRLILPASADYI